MLPARPHWPRPDLVIQRVVAHASGHIFLIKCSFRLKVILFVPLRLRLLPAFADVARGRLRLLLSGPASSAGRPMPDGAKPGPGGWNRIHLIVDDIEAEVARLRAAGATFRNEILAGPGGKQILLQDPSGNVVELFQPAAVNPTRRDPAR
jgi:Glyoxalase-like domain